MKIMRIVSVGLAMFAMFFGSGNLVLPLVLGRAVGDNAWYAMIGFFLTAALIPVIGVIAAVLFDGDYKKFLGRLGTIPGAFIAMLCLALIGPFGIVPRCITVAYASVQWYLPDWISLGWFSMIASVILALCTLRPSNVIELMGKILGPLKLVLLGVFVIQGLMRLGVPVISTYTPLESLSHGLLMGYGTLDLVGAIFFSGLILSSLRSAVGAVSHRQLLTAAIQAGLIGALLLGIVYAGFLMIAAFHGHLVPDAGPAELFSMLSMLLLGHHAGALANATVALATMTTAIALTTVFASYLSKDLTAGFVSYPVSLLVTLGITILFTNLGFVKIMQIVQPIVEIFYPALVVLALVNIAYKLYGFKPVKIPVYTTLLLSLLAKLLW